MPSLHEFIMYAQTVHVKLSQEDPSTRPKTPHLAPSERTNHYANFHLLRGKDNLNKSDTPPHKWFKKPGDQPAYSDYDLSERLLTWDLLQPGNFPLLLEERTKLIHKRALELFGKKTGDLDALFCPPQGG